MFKLNENSIDLIEKKWKCSFFFHFNLCSIVYITLKLFVTPNGLIVSWGGGLFLLLNNENNSDTKILWQIWKKVAIRIFSLNSKNATGFKWKVAI